MAPLMRRSRRSAWPLSTLVLSACIALFLLCQVLLAYQFLWRSANSVTNPDSNQKLSLGFISLGDSVPALSIIISVIGASEREYSKGFDALRAVFNKAKGFLEGVEVVIVHAGVVTAPRLTNFGDGKPNWSVQYVLLPREPSHPAAWNLAIRHYARGAFLTKLDFAGFVRGEVTQITLQMLEKKVQLLQSLPLAQVAFAKFGKGGGSAIKSSDFFSFDETKKPIAGLSLELDRSPVWRQSLHEAVGYFDTGLASAAEWAFWLKALQHGLQAVRLTDDPLGLMTAAEPSESEELAVVSKYLFGGLVNLTAGVTQKAEASTQKADGLRILVIHEHVPFRNEGGEKRLMQVVHSLIGSGHKVWYLYRGWGAKPAHRAKLESLGVQLIPDSHLTDPRSEIRTLQKPAVYFETHDFDAAVMTAWFYKQNETAGSLALSIPEVYSPLMRTYNPRSCVAVLTDDVHWSRNLDSVWCHKDEGPECFRKLKDREQAVYLDADVLFTVSESDSRFLEAWLPPLDPRPQFLPFVGTLNRDNRASNPLSQREIITFVGSNHPINEAGLRWFFDEVFPVLQNLLRPLPDVYLIGEGWKDSPLSNPLGVWAPGLLKSDSELDKYLQRTRVFISPMVKGTGVATKNVLAMENGIPLVTTTWGKRGLLVRENEPPFLIADHPADFAGHIIRLFSDDHLWHEMSDAGLWHVRHVLNPGLQGAVLEGQLRECVARKRG
ncbi:hypothetical protein KFL_006290060 [Klebsormidium nitens]|uniref:Glycosyltransferase n=1 Tax=Klebsormidium nitens TaxID=105231 RepID=A0A1Y1IMH0_KLENI|nr:hypothetical protein KFL_006290060 [Klebsormidium nitens]|eukprot:GAQ90341.1 hypothetical protein KFL_006290060 [Klebsormidium nitens]